MTAASEKISEERLRELRDMCADPQPFLTETAKKPFTADIAIALDAYLSLRAEHEEMRQALRVGREVLAAVIGDIEDGFSLGDMRAKYLATLLGARDGMDAAQGAARGTG